MGVFGSFRARYVRISFQCTPLLEQLPTPLHCHLFFLYGLSKKLAFVPVASAMTAVHRDRLVLAFYAPPPEIQPLESFVSVRP